MTQEDTRYTVPVIESEFYQMLAMLSVHYPIANDWLAKLPHWLIAIKDKNRYANAPYYASLVAKLPNVAKQKVMLNTKEVSVIFDMNDNDTKKTQALLKGLMPWRKGGFRLGDGDNVVYIDTEWRSDLKWDRVSPLVDLVGKRVLDVGGGSGYHGFRMVGAGADTVVVIDPSPLFYYQFMAIRQLMGRQSNRFGQSPIHFAPVALEQLPQAGLFNVVFCMGVLYHRPSPLDCLYQLKSQLLSGGQLVLETLVVDGDEHTVFVPEERYAMMNNVYFLPSVLALTKWLKKCGFIDIRCIDVATTSTDEQRATEWMTYQSLKDFLHPNDQTKTIEGYPAPKRAVMLASVL